MCHLFLYILFHCSELSDIENRSTESTGTSLDIVKNIVNSMMIKNIGNSMMIKNIGNSMMIKNIIIVLNDPQKIVFPVV